ncbi:MAG: ribosome assembly RNA-binding protein YhbY [Corallincola sp.]|nr:ribosome assembly RNA-binding protein YhbY [Corallincola sp.]
MSKPLTTKQKQYLKGLAHPLKPVVLLGNNGLTEGVMAEIDLALGHHELIKVKLPGDDREMRQAVINTIVAHTACTLVQLIGKTAVFYRPANEPVISLPKR